MESTIYQIIDSKTGLQVGTDYTYSQRNRARNRADKLDLEYGGYRYQVRPVFNK